MRRERSPALCRTQTDTRRRESAYSPNSNAQYKKNTGRKSNKTISAVKDALFIERPVLQILFVDAVVGEVSRFLKQLKQIPFLTNVYPVSSVEDFARQTEFSNYDIILVKPPVPSWWKNKILEFFARLGEQIPVILLLKTQGHNGVEELLTDGIVDCIHTGDVRHLSIPICRALGMKTLDVQRSKAYEKLRNPEVH